MMKALSGLVLAAGLVASASAGAATYDLGTLTTGVTQFGGYLVNGTFSDTIDFTISSLSTVSTGVGVLNFTMDYPDTSTPFMDISSFNLTLYNSKGVELGSGADITLNKLGAGSYYAVMSGIADGPAGGEYGGGISVSPVPESGSLAMLLTGLGLLGFVVSRRKA